MTLDDLQKIYHAAWRDDEGYNPQRAGVTAIVRALRDEAAGYFTPSGVRGMFDQIIGTDAGEKDAARAAYWDKHYGTDEPASPATDTMPPLYKMLEMPDAAPAPCLWRVHHETRNGPLYVSQCGGGWRHATSDPKCPSCGKEIFFPTDAAPAVCVWTGEEYVTYSTSCESEHEVDPHKAPPTHCPSCGLPIKFTEANHG